MIMVVLAMKNLTRHVRFITVTMFFTV